MLDDYDSSYPDLLIKAGKTTMEIKRLRVLALEVFKTLNNLNPCYMKDIFHRTNNDSHRQNNLLVHHHNKTKYGDKSLRILGPRIWNSLPEKMKSVKNVETFRKLINEWCGPCCKCSICK